MYFCGFYATSTIPLCYGKSEETKERICSMRNTNETRLKVVQVVVEDEHGNTYPVNIETGYMAKTQDKVDVAAHLMASIFAAGGWDALINYLKRVPSDNPLDLEV